MTLGTRDGRLAASWRIAIAAAVTVAGCRGGADTFAPNGQWSSAGLWSGQVVITPDVGSSRWPADPVTIGPVSVTGDSISIQVTYGGGCREHAFQLLAETAWMESYPVQLGLRLSHDAMRDPCDALLTRTLRFDLTPLKTAYQASYRVATGTIVLRLSGAPSSPSYAF